MTKFIFLLRVMGSRSLAFIYPGILILHAFGYEFRLLNIQQKQKATKMEYCRKIGVQIQASEGMDMNMFINSLLNS